MSILAASQQNNILDAALGYLEAGVSVLPVRGKQPSMGWAKYQTQHAAFSHVHNWNRAGCLSGVGVVCGAVSGNLVVIDLDGLDAVRTFWSAFPELCGTTFTVTSGSGTGKHIYLYCDDLPPTTRTKGFELRGNGCYVVAPPSPHPSGNLYRVSTALEVARVNNLNVLVKWIKSRMVSSSAAAHPAAATHIPAGVRDGSRYAAAALRGECDAVRSGREGDANNRLFRAALKMGSLIADGLLTRADVEGALMLAASALSERDGERATMATIKSGIQTGEMSKRSAKRTW